MTRCFGYIRVSTAKQGEQGVSLEAQRDAIERYAREHGIEIAEWFEERESAAKRGRPVFARMVKLLAARRVEGVVIHKIDRSARNLKDWADLGELIDRGVAVHFVSDNLDLTSRGGRLSADIQAVIAADYIRNLREETKKGLYGRLKQGIYPLGAPIGYLDMGGGKRKEIDPVQGPLVREAFELYATRQYGLPALTEIMRARGLTTKAGGSRGKPISQTGLWLALKNPFYTGLIRMKKAGLTFEGIHEPLISKRLFDRVQVILSGKHVPKIVKHDFTFRKLFRCSECRTALIGERQKSHVYYRCHTKRCPVKGVREEKLEEAVAGFLETFQFRDGVREIFAAALEERGIQASEEAQRSRRAFALQLDATKSRLDRLTDAYLEGAIDRESYEERRTRFLEEKRRIEDEIASLDGVTTEETADAKKILELAERASLSHQKANTTEKRRILDLLTSNRTVSPNDVVIEPSLPFSLLVKDSAFRSCPQTRASSRSGRSLLHRQKITPSNTRQPSSDTLTLLLTWIAEHPSEARELASFRESLRP